MADIINNGVPTPAMIYGRAPNGQLQAVTTDGSGNISFAGAGGSPTFPVNSQTVSYQTLAADFSSFKLITMNGSFLTLTLLAVAPTAGQGILVQNISAFALTISRNGLNIDGAASNLTLAPNSGITIVSDGSNYFTSRGDFGNQNISFSGNTLTIGLAGSTFGVLTLNDSTGGAGVIATNGTGPILVNKSLGLLEIAAPAGVANTDVLYGFSGDHSFYQNLNNGGAQPLPRRGMLTGGYTNATTTPSNITGLSFAVAANLNYTMTCHLYFQGSAGTAGLDIAITGPTSPTSVFYSYDEDATATSLQDSVASAFGTKLTGNTTVAATTNLHATVTMGLVNGVNAGTIQVQGSATGVGTVTIQNGSFCIMQ